MANKKDFKKYVSAISSSIVQDMMTAYYNTENVNGEEIDKAIIKILKAAEKALLHTNVKFDKTAKGFDNKFDYRKAKHEFYAALYRKVNSDFAVEINEALSVFNASFPAEVKAANIN